LRGPGETQLEVDRREIGRRIANLRSQLEKVREHRGRHREQRRRAAIPTVALVGYTNAGKSTLLNQLSNANVLVADKLFATLDPTTRRVELPGGNEVLFTDTVGFIQKLPTTLVAAFRATLEEIGDSDLLLHVVDVTHPNALAQAEAVRATLDEIVDKDIPRFTALNKIDRLPNPESVHEFIDEFERAVPISALRGDGITSLLSAIEIELNEQLAEICVEIPYRSGRLISLFHQLGRVEHQENRTETVILSGRLPQKYLPQYQIYLMNRNQD
ncbi:MAG: GTPase HflX, partial [Anaerolineales bacterium]